MLVRELFGLLVQPSSSASCCSDRHEVTVQLLPLPPLHAVAIDAAGAAALAAGTAAAGGGGAVAGEEQADLQGRRQRVLELHVRPRRARHIRRGGWLPVEASVQLVDGEVLANRRHVLGDRLLPLHPTFNSRQNVRDALHQPLPSADPTDLRLQHRRELNEAPLVQLAHLLRQAQASKAAEDLVVGMGDPMLLQQPLPRGDRHPLLVLQREPHRQEQQGDRPDREDRPQLLHQDRRVHAVARTALDQHSEADPEHQVAHQQLRLNVLDHQLMGIPDVLAHSQRTLDAHLLSEDVLGHLRLMCVASHGHE
mmetsp:Transcript_124148/g.397067  ORF Transcript_124148/g.397067 Transcript_124148/m.397067 type:complete len:309 (-) Transcript_124148:243-1169(-)